MPPADQYWKNHDFFKDNKIGTSFEVVAEKQIMIGRSKVAFLWTHYFCSLYFQILPKYPPQSTVFPAINTDPMYIYSKNAIKVAELSFREGNHKQNFSAKWKRMDKSNEIDKCKN